MSVANPRRHSVETPWVVILLLLAAVVGVLPVVSVLAQDGAGEAVAGDAVAPAGLGMILWFQAFLLFVTLIGYPVAAWWIRGRGAIPVSGNSDKQRPDRALFLPNGSFRAILAVIVVGSFVNVLVGGLMSSAPPEHFAQVVTAFGTLSGSVIGFYFGTRGSQRSPDKS